MRLEHVGVAVRDVEASIALLRSVLGARPYKSERVSSEDVLTVFFDAGGSKIELLEGESPNSPISRHIESRGEGLHHLAFAVENIEEAYQRLEDAGFRLLNDAPKHGADGKLIFFIHPKDTGSILIELCQDAKLPLEPVLTDIGGRALARYELGRKDAPRIVMLHAALGTVGLELVDLMRALEPELRIIAFDLPGHGNSDDGDEEMSLAGLAADLLKALDAMALERTNIFGLSLGGAIALEIARMAPGRVTRLAVHATTARWSHDEARTMVSALDPERLVRDKPHHADRLAVAHGPERWSDLSQRVREFITRLPDDPLTDEQLAAIPHPILISHGDADRVFDISHALHLRRTLPRANLAVLPQAEHVIRTPTTKLLATMLREFFLQA